MKKFSLLAIAFLFIFTIGCGKKKPICSYKIGVDPSFFPLELMDQKFNVFAFTNELLQEISKLKGVQIERVHTTWDNLFDGLKLQKFDAAISPASPNIINMEKYSFSERFLQTGPVLVAPKSKKDLTLKKLAGELIAIERSDALLELMSNYPKVEFKFYERIPLVLDDVTLGNFKGCLVPIIPATAYLKDLFQDSLVIATKPLTEEGLRLVTCKDSCPSVIELFNSGLKELKESGKFDDLMIKWIIPSSSN